MPSKKETIIPIKSAIEASKNPLKKVKKPTPPTPPPAPAAVSKRKPPPPPVEEESEEEEEVHELFSETEEEDEPKVFSKKKTLATSTLSGVDEPKKAPKQYKPREKPLVKRERTARQIEVFKAALEKREENRQMRKAEKELKKAEQKKIDEDKIIKKGLALKKKQIVRAAILNDDDSDVDIPNEIVEKVLRKKSKSKEPKAEVQERPVPDFVPKFTFV